MLQRPTVVLPRSPLLAVVGALVVLAFVAGDAVAKPPLAATQGMTEVLGRPTAQSIALSVLAPTALEAYVEFGTAAGQPTGRTATRASRPAVPVTHTLTGLSANTRYFYRLRYRQPGEAEFRVGAEHDFMTQRAPGSTFTFGLQGDSHPEREGKMFWPSLYTRTMNSVSAGNPDFYVTLGDDFSLDRLITSGTLSRTRVEDIYVNQRRYLSRVGSGAPLFLVNGNHEQADRTALDGTPRSSAVLAGNARKLFYPLPAPDAFYTGDTERVRFVGQLRDYYAWTWGDALFVVIDPYWHSPVQVDNAPGAGGTRTTTKNKKTKNKKGKTKSPKTKIKQGGKKRDLWKVSIGDAQYQWLKRTLEGSTAKYKFVFAHHVMGTGRGAVEVAPFYEWGGKDPSGADLFKAKRPTWELPIHQLMVKTGVSVFFQGHDHLYARQELDGVVYQETPNPADPTYTAFNKDAYRSGTLLPNSGHLRVTVSPENARVDYVRSYLPKDETATRKNGEIAFSYTVKPRP